MNQLSLSYHFPQISVHAKQSTTSPGAGECPSSHPFAYWNGGQYCCPTNIDKQGITLTLDSLSCENNAQVECPHGKCINYGGLYPNFCSCLLTTMQFLGFIQPILIFSMACSYLHLIFLSL